MRGACGSFNYWLFLQVSRLGDRFSARKGGKSGLHRVKRQVTPGGREPTESAAESRPPMASLEVQVRLKGCGKSAPRHW